MYACTSQYDAVGLPWQAAQSGAPPALEPSSAAITDLQVPFDFLRSVSATSIRVVLSRNDLFVVDLFVASPSLRVHRSTFMEV